MRGARPSVALFVSSSEEISDTLVHARLLDLLDRGWEAHLVCDGRGVSSKDVSELPRPVLDRRVHLSRPYRRRWAARALTLGLGDALVRNPAGTWRHLRGGWRPTPWRIRERGLDANLLALRPRLVHFHSAASAMERMSLRAALGCRMVVSFRPDELPPGGPDGYAPVFESADGLHFPHQELDGRAVEDASRRRAPRAVIPPPLDAAPLDPRVEQDDTSPPNRPLRVLSVGPLDWRQGHEHALHALKLLLERGVECEYRILGDGDYADGVAFARHQLGLHEWAQLLPAVPLDGLRPHLRWADVLLDVAVAERWSGALARAQAMALPLVVSERTTPPAGVEGSETGFAVPRRDPHAIAERLALLAGDPALRRRMGAAGRARATQRSRDYLADFDALYRATLAA